MNLSIYGHAGYSILSYTVDGTYREYVLPQGAPLIQMIIHLSNLSSDDEKPVSFMANAPNYEQVTNDGLINYRRDYFTLKRYIPGGRDDDDVKGYVIDKHSGSRVGTPENSIYTLPPSIDAAADVIIWDGGYGGLVAPENCNTALWSSNKVLPDKEQFERIADRCVLLLDADVLRRAGAMISRQISWERTCGDLIRQIQTNDRISYLMKARHIVIIFAHDGAVYIDNTGGTPLARLVLTHGGAEGSIQETVPGEIEDIFVYMTAVAGLMYPAFFTKEVWSNDIIRLILECGEARMRDGYPMYQHKDGLFINLTILPRKWAAFDIPLEQSGAEGHYYTSDNWTISGNIDDDKLYSMAFDYVMRGSVVIAGLPQLALGALTTIDRWEIESYQNIRNAILNYAAGDSLKPLSIAVFGSPGSGKSFGVTQIAQSILPGKIEKLEFNVSQFVSTADLGAAFQMVRDAILLGKLPLVFFDEFDSNRDGIQLGWVKNFLMPMQDGKFRDESGEHPLGRCVLVFAGGTAASFSGFNCSDREWFINAKGPDFVSRLKGTVNVPGPNRLNNEDRNYVLRRALLLRSLCKSKLAFNGSDAPINKAIVRAMLLVPEYKHGARSMEAILDMSRITGGTWEPASLPSHSQLALHVDENAFINLILKDYGQK